MNKFKTGDFVVCNSDSGCGGFTKGNVYEVKDIDGTLNVVKDNKGRLNNGWSQRWFDLLTPDMWQEGDILRCVHYTYNLDAGKEYTFDKGRDDYDEIYVKESGLSWLSSRFEFVSRPKTYVESLRESIDKVSETAKRKEDFLKAGENWVKVAPEEGSVSKVSDVVNVEAVSRNITYINIIKSNGCFKNIRSKNLLKYWVPEKFRFDLSNYSPKYREQIIAAINKKIEAIGYYPVQDDRSHGFAPMQQPYVCFTASDTVITGDEMNYPEICLLDVKEFLGDDFPEYTDVAAIKVETSTIGDLSKLSPREENLAATIKQQGEKIAEQVEELTRQKNILTSRIADISEKDATIKQLHEKIDNLGLSIVSFSKTHDDLAKQVAAKTAEIDRLNRKDKANFDTIVIKDKILEDRAAIIDRQRKDIMQAAKAGRELAEAMDKLPKSLYARILSRLIG